MAGFVGKFVVKKVLGETLENKFGKEVSYLLRGIYFGKAPLTL